MIFSPDALFTVISITFNLGIVCVVSLFLAGTLLYLRRRGHESSFLRFSRWLFSTLALLSGGAVLAIIHEAHTMPKALRADATFSAEMGEDLVEIVSRAPTTLTYEVYPTFTWISSSSTYTEEVRGSVSSLAGNSFAIWPTLDSAEKTSVDLTVVIHNKSTLFPGLRYVWLGTEKGKVSEVTFFTPVRESFAELKTDLSQLLDRLKLLGLNYEGSWEDDWYKEVTLKLSDGVNRFEPLRRELTIGVFSVAVSLNSKSGDSQSVQGYYHITIKSDRVTDDAKLKQEVLSGKSDASSPEASTGEVPHTESEIAASLVDFGMYSVDFLNHEADSEVAGGLGVTSDKKLLKETDVIEGKPGVSFGFRYKLFRRGAPETSPTPRHDLSRRERDRERVHQELSSAQRLPDFEYVTIKVTHPKPLRDPQTGKEYAVSSWGQSVPVSTANDTFVNWNTGWLLEHEWEIVEGEWVIQLFAKDRLLLERKFMLIR